MTLDELAAANVAGQLSDDDFLKAVSQKASGGITKPPPDIDLSDIEKQLALEVMAEQALDPRKVGGLIASDVTKEPQQHVTMQDLGGPVETPEAEVRLDDIFAAIAQYEKQHGPPPNPLHPEAHRHPSNMPTLRGKQQPRQPLWRPAAIDYETQPLTDAQVAQLEVATTKREVAFCTGRELPIDLVTRLVALWNIGMPLHAMVKDANARLAPINKYRDLEEIDLYAIITLAKHDEMDREHYVKQREPVKDRTLPNELSLEQFKKFLAQWRHGGTLALCSKVVIPFQSVHFLRKIFSQLMSRHRLTARERELKNARTLQADDKPTVFDRLFSKHAARYLINELPYLVYPVRHLPPELLSRLDALPYLNPKPKATDPNIPDIKEPQLPPEILSQERQKQLDEQLRQLNQKPTAIQADLDRTLPTPEEPEFSTGKPDENSDGPPLDPSPETATAEAESDFTGMSLEELLGIDPTE